MADHSIIDDDNRFGEIIDNQYGSSDTNNPIYNMDSKYYDVEDLSELSESTHKFKYRIIHINIQGLLSSLDNLKLLLERLAQNKVTIDVILINSNSNSNSLY